MLPFKSCGENVSVAGDVYIEHPEVMEIGDDVTFMRGHHGIIDRASAVWLKMAS